MTLDQLKKYENRLYELKLLIENCCIAIKFNPSNKIACNNLRKYSDEFKYIEKILKRAEKQAKKNNL